MSREDLNFYCLAVFALLTLGLSIGYLFRTQQLQSRVDQAPAVEQLIWVKNQLQRGQLEEALEDCNQALQKNPYLAEGLSLRSRIYYEQRKWALAYRDANRALEIDPKLSEAQQVSKLVSQELGLASDHH